MYHRFTGAFCTTTLCSLLLVSPALLAESDGPLPEIIVTADFDGETDMEMSGSVTVVTADVFASRGAQHFEDVVLSIPNVNFAAGSNRARYFQIRGIGERSQFIDPINPSVGVLIDDVDFSGAGGIATLADVEQVEVLRGPQGTRYGANALAGLINFKTRDPGVENYARLEAGTSSYGGREYTLVANLPVSEQFLTRWVVNRQDSDGFIENLFLDRDDTMRREEVTTRGKLQYQVNDSWVLGMTLARVDVDNGYDAFSLDNLRTTLSDEPGFDRQESDYLSLKSEWTGERYDWVLLVNQSDSDLGYGYDEDWAYTGIHPFGYTSTDQYFRERQTHSVELRIQSNDTSRWFADRTDWTVGAYLLSSDEDLKRVYTFAAADYFSSYNFDTWALFAQLDTQVSDQLTLGTGIRVERRDTDFSDSNGVSFDPTDTLWGGTLSLEYLTESGALLYGMISRGYKAGGFNTDGTLDADLREFDEEYLIEYEAGYKASLADTTVDLQLALFVTDRHDQQVKSSLVRPRPDGSTEFIDFFGNAAEGTNRGLEASVRWYLSEHWSVSGSAGYLDASFDRYINEFGEDLSGRDQAHAPGYMANLALNWLQGPWSATLTLDAKDRFYFSDRHSVQSESYTLFHLSGAYTADTWEIRAWSRNLTDEDYYTRAFGSFGNDPRKGYITEPYYQYGEPRVSGVTVSFTTGM